MRKGKESWNAPKSIFSSFLNQYPSALVTKVTLKVPQSQAASAKQILERFRYRLQCNVHGINKSHHGGFGYPILVSWKAATSQRGISYYVAVTFNLKTFGDMYPERIKRQVRKWIQNAWASATGKYIDTAVHLVTFPSGYEQAPFTPLIHGNSEYRTGVESLEMKFAGGCPTGTEVGEPFEHWQGFYPRSRICKTNKSGWL